MTVYIGLGHASRVGKDTLANYIVKKASQRGLDARKFSFAWLVKDVANQLYGWADLRHPGFYDQAGQEDFRQITLPKLGMSPVEVWVKLGMAMREIHADTWVECLFPETEGAELVVIPDVRFPNEVRAIRDRKGILVKVVRPGYGPLGTPADIALAGYDGWDFVVGHSGELHELQEFAVRIVAGLVKQLRPEGPT